MNNEYMNDVYKTNTAFIRVFVLKLWSLGDCNCAIFEISTIAFTWGPEF